MKTLKISADVQSAKNSIKELDNSLKNITASSSGKKTSVFDQKDLALFGKWADKQIPSVKKDIDKLKKEMQGISNLDLLKESSVKLDKLESKLKRLEKIKLGTVDGGGKLPPEGALPGTQAEGGGGGIGGFLGGKLGRFLGPAAVLGAGAALFGRGLQAYGQRTSEAPSRLNLMGAAGQGEMQRFFAQGGPYQGRGLGFDVDQTLEQANRLVREVGNLGQLNQIQKTSRAYGIDTEQLIQQAGTFRRVAGQENVQKNQATLLASAISSGLDQGLLAEYMRETAAFTEEMAREGTADTKQVMQAVSGLVRQGGILSDTGRTTRELGSLNQAIQQAQGARFGFFAQAMEKTLGPKATGSQVLLGLNQGLFGQDTSRLTALSKEQREELSLGGSDFQKRTQSIVSEFEDMTKGMDTASKALIASRVTGIKDAGAAFNFLNALKTGKYSEKEAREMEKAAKASPEAQALDQISKTLDMRISQVDARNKENLSRLGEAIVPSVNKVKDSLLDVESRTLVPIAKGVDALVNKIVGKEKEDKGILGKIGDLVGNIGANIITGGQLAEDQVTMRQRVNIDPLAMMEKKQRELPDFDEEDLSVGGKPFERTKKQKQMDSLRTLYDMESEFTSKDLENVKESMKTFNKDQQTTVQLKAWESLLNQTRDLAIAKKKGEKLPNEMELGESIKNLSGLIPEGQKAPLKLRKIHSDVIKDNGLMPYIEEIANKALPQKSAQVKQAFEEPSKTELTTGTDNFSKISQSLDKLTNALESNTQATDLNSRRPTFVPGSAGVGGLTYPGVGSIGNTRRGTR